MSSRLLAWRPDDFWRATPAELAAALDEPTPYPLSWVGGGMIGAELRRLMEQFPDG